MTAIDMSQIKQGVAHVRSLIDLFGELREQLSDLTLRDFLPFARRRSPASAVAWFSAGVATGAAAATMFSPKRGEQLRDDIARAADKLGDRLADKWRERREANRRAPAEASRSSDGETRVHPVRS